MTHPAPEPAPVTTWQAAETVAAAWMRHWGYTDAALTGGSSDGGIDIRATQALAQVKFKAAQAGRPEVQNLVGAAGRNAAAQLIFFSAAGYSTHALAYANQQHVALFTFGPFGAIEPANHTARSITRRARIAAAAKVVNAARESPALDTEPDELDTPTQDSPESQADAAESLRGCGGCLVVSAAFFLVPMVISLVLDVGRGTFEPSEVDPALKMFGSFGAILAIGCVLYVAGRRLDQKTKTPTPDDSTPPPTQSPPD